MKTIYHVIHELLLVLASVLIFRSGWTLLDRHVVPLNGDLGLVVALVIGCIVAGFSIYMLSKEFHAN